MSQDTRRESPLAMGCGSCGSFAAHVYSKCQNFVSIEGRYRNANVPESSESVSTSTTTVLSRFRYR